MCLCTMPVTYTPKQMSHTHHTHGTAIVCFIISLYKFAVNEIDVHTQTVQFHVVEFYFVRRLGKCHIAQHAYVQ